MIRLGYSGQNNLLTVKVHNQLQSTKDSSDILAYGVEHGIELLQNCARNNLVHLSQLLTWNHVNNIHLFVLPPQLFPYAFHPYFGYPTSFATFELSFLSNICQQFHQRILFSLPSEHCNLGSLQSHRTLDSTRAIHTFASILHHFSEDCMLVVTIAGVQPKTSDEEFFENEKEFRESINKEATLQRWEECFYKLPDSVKNRIALQNDSFRYTARDLLPICQKYNIPLSLHTLYDTIHGNCANECRSAIRSTWEKRNITPLVFHGESKHDAHSIKEKLMECNLLVDFPGLWDTMDVVLLSAAKEQSVLHIHKNYGVYVNMESVLDVTLENSIETQKEQWKEILNDLP